MRRGSGTGRVVVARNVQRTPGAYVVREVYNYNYV